MGTPNGVCLVVCVDFFASWTWMCVGVFIACVLVGDNIK